MARAGGRLTHREDLGDICNVAWGWVVDLVAPSGCTDRYTGIDLPERRDIPADPAQFLKLPEAAKIKGTFSARMWLNRNRQHAARPPQPERSE